MANLCSKGLHDLDNPSNIRRDRRGVVICRVCDREYQRARSKSGEVTVLPPDTKTVINGYKEPLRPVEGGYGYYGTIAYDESEEFAQCHFCGYLYKHLGKHVRAAHDMTSTEYKEEIGLLKSTSLFAPKTRSIYLEVWANKSESERAEILARLRTRQGSTKGERAGIPQPKALEYYNLRGNCPDQLIDKILSLAEKLGHTPTSTEFKKEYGRGMLHSAQYTFGTYTELVKVAELAPVVNPNNRLRFSEEEVIEILRSFKKRYGRDPYYSDIRTYHLPWGGVYKRLFGSWLNAKRAAFGDEIVIKRNRYQ